jgi:hypothetical protein
VRHLSPLAEVLGAAQLLAAAFLFDWRAGMALVGVLLIFVGYVLDRPPRADG